MWQWTVLILSAYLLGSVSLSVLLTRALIGRDLRRLGSGNAGATNVLRTVGWWPALWVLAADLGKGALVVVVGRWLAAPGWAIGSAAVAVVVGHMLPLYHGFRGGKGVATAAGVMFLLAPLASLLGLLLFVVITLGTRYVALGSVVAVASFPLLAWLAGRLAWSAVPPRWLLLAAWVIGMLIVIKHAENGLRIWRGTEWKLGDPRGPEEAK